MPVMLLDEGASFPEGYGHDTKHGYGRNRSHQRRRAARG